jgi:AcrR family transcriptional regulator
VKEEHNRDNIKKNITSTALKMFLEKGIKDVKMDDIASALSISKRTIYELYNDKEQLLYESVKLNGEIMRKEAKKRIREAKNVLEIVLGLYGIYFERLKSVNKKFFTEIEKYPNIYRHNKDREAKNYKRFIAWMESGREEGLFRKDANFEILLYILRRDLNTIFKVNIRNEENELAKYTPEELGRTLILFYLRGISTPKGQEIIEMYLKDNEKRI